MKKLTVKGLESLKREDKAYFVAVSEGLRLRIAVDGEKTWHSQRTGCITSRTGTARSRENHWLVCRTKARQKQLRKSWFEASVTAIPPPNLESFRCIFWQPNYRV
jgi:hypothetical protein